MSPQIALLLCILFILSVLIIDYSRQPNLSRVLWIPLIWMLIIGSRPVSLWFNLATPMVSTNDYLRGSPFDRNIYLMIIAIGLLILFKRKIIWSKFIKVNAWLVLFYVYCGISILWSDYPFVSFKRWIKGAGNLLMVLVILTDPDPFEAVRLIMKRCAYVLIPLSVVLIKYYPALGRVYHVHSGVALSLGVTTNKNALGILCFTCFLFFFWNLLTMRRNRNISVDKKELFVHVLYLIMIYWLLIMANSATPLICIIIGTCLVIGIEFPIVRNNLKYIGHYAVILCLSFIFLQLSFDITQVIITQVGRDMTLTGRTEVWNELIDIGANPITGTGYDSFWLGDRTANFQERWNLNQAHNGYLEIYLNLGFIGLFLFIGVIVSSYKKTKLDLMSNFDYGRFRMALLVTVLSYNITEAVFFGLNMVWFIFLFAAVDIPKES